MTTPTTEGDNMGDDANIEVETGEHGGLPDGYEIDADLVDEIEKVDVASDFVRIRMGVNVNGYKRGDELTVDRDNEFWSGMIDQRIAEVID